MALVASGPAAARAPRPLLTGFSDPWFNSADSQARGAALDQSVAAHAAVVRVTANWHNIAIGVPANPRDPADPAYDFGQLDAAVRDATSSGLDVVVMVVAAPAYAEAPGRPDTVKPGTWLPDPAAFADFGAAIARRYSGGFSDLPHVDKFQAWNEPNLPGYLTPQYDGEQPVAPAHYRSMLNAFYAAVKSVDPTDLVLTAGTAPYGDAPGGSRTRPLVFWRDVLCIADQTSLRAAPCPERAAFDILAHHPINTSGGPRVPSLDPDDVSVSELGELRRVLRASERKELTATAGPHPIWATEIWWNSNPPDALKGIPLSRQARWLELSMYLLWRQGASAVINLQVRDQPEDPPNPFDNLSTGVYFADGSPKPSLTAFRFPFVTDRRRGDRLLAWGRAPVAGKLVIRRRAHGRWRRVDSFAVGADAVFKTRLALRGAQRLRAEVGGQRSLVWNQGGR